MIAIVTVSLHPHSSVLPPSEPIVTVCAITTTSISLSWSVPTDQIVTISEVMWQASHNGGPTSNAETSGRITDTSYTIKELESSASYVFTVTVTNVAGSTTSSPMIVITSEGVVLLYM